MGKELKPYSIVRLEKRARAVLQSVPDWEKWEEEQKQFWIVSMTGLSVIYTDALAIAATFSDADPEMLQDTRDAVAKVLPHHVDFTWEESEKEGRDSLILLGTQIVEGMKEA